MKNLIGKVLSAAWAAVLRVATGKELLHAILSVCIQFLYLVRELPVTSIGSTLSRRSWEGKPPQQPPFNAKPRKGKRDAAADLSAWPSAERATSMTSLGTPFYLCFFIITVR